MKKRKGSIDGFTSRQFINRSNDGSVLGSQKDKLFNSSHGAGAGNGRSAGGSYAKRPDLNESLKSIGNLDEPERKMSWRQYRRLKKIEKNRQGKTKSKIKSIAKWLFIMIILGGISFGGYMGYKFIKAGNNIFQGSIVDIFKTQPLQQDKNGRSNFLILGTSEDNEGHEGSDLTDSILIVSVDQNKKNIFMFSIPRDLYVEYGKACAPGYQGKINAYFSCSDDGETPEAEQNRLRETQELIGDIVGLDIQYGLHVNHTVIKQVVDAIGGIDVDVQGSNGDPGVFDRSLDWRCNYNCYLVKYDNGVHHLDGEHALYLAQARGDTSPTYGLSNSNFDREKNQQKIIAAIKEKAMTTGVLADVGAVTKIIDALGDNLRTNIQTSEIRTIMQVASEIKSDQVLSISLYGDGKSVFKTGGYSGQSIVMPSAGIFEYEEIQDYISQNLSADPVEREAAPVVVLNGSGVVGLAQKKADELTEQGLNVILVDNAPDGQYETVEVYHIGDESTATASKLEAIYGVKVKTDEPPCSVSSDVQFVVIIGAAGNE